MRHRLHFVAMLVALLVAASAAAKPERVKRKPAELEAGRFTVAVDRRPERMAEIARQLLALDLFLGQVLGLPAERLDRPVTFAYLHRTHRMEKRLPFRGDRIGHEHLLPTDLRLWVLLREDTGLEELRYPALQVAEVDMARAGELPPWLRSGLFELMARLALLGNDLLLMPATFPALHGAGLARAPMEATVEPGWSRYQEPQRWYTSTLVVAYLFDTDRDALARAVAAPHEFSLLEELDTDGFEAWVDGAVTEGEGEPQVLLEEVGGDVGQPTAMDEAAVDRLEVALAQLHHRGAKAFRLSDSALGPHDAVGAELRGGVPGEACTAVLSDDSVEGLYLQGMCLWQKADAAAEEAFRRAWRNRRGLERAAVQAAAMALAEPGRESDAATLVAGALRASPADPDALLLETLIRARAGECEGWDEPDEPTWSPIRHVPGPMESYRDRFVREILECRKVAANAHQF